MTRPASIVRLHATRDAWLAEREGRITGTKAAAVLGWSPWSDPWTVHASEVHGIAGDGPSPEVAARGHELEPVALARYRRANRLVSSLRLLDTDAQIVTVTRADRPLWLASPDALVLNADDRIVGGVEVKTVSRSDLGRFWDDDNPEPAWTRELDGRDVGPDDDGAHIPPAWMAQILTYLEVTGADWWDLVVLGPHIDQTAILRVYADLQAQAALVQRVEGWWRHHILEKHPPPVDGSDACAAVQRAQWPPECRHRIKVVDAPEVDELAAGYVDAASRGKAAEADRKLARNQLIAALGGDTARAATAGHNITIDKRGALRVTARRTT